MRGICGKEQTRLALNISGFRSFLFVVVIFRDETEIHYLILTRDPIKFYMYITFVIVRQFSLRLNSLLDHAVIKHPTVHLTHNILWVLLQHIELCLCIPLQAGHLDQRHKDTLT